jgi:hypothetical protein
VFENELCNVIPNVRVASVTEMFALEGVQIIQHSTA